jgi:PPM family protein phosphatase
VYWEQRVEYAALTDIGFRRRNNQDSYCVLTSKSRDEWQDRGHVFLVADGMGGHAVGELASKIAADTVPHTFLKLKEMSVVDAIRASVETAHRAIHERGEQNRDFNRMGTTCTTLVLTPLGAVIGHVGDSRCYRIRAGRIEQLTFDHSLQWELIRQGKMSPEHIMRYEPRNVITRSLGPQPTVQVDVEGPYAIRPGDVYLLCSDGLTGQVPDEEIGQIASALAPADACRFLVDLANLRGGPDNITVVITRVGETPAGMPPVPADPPSRDLQPGWGWFVSVALLSVLYVCGIALTAMQNTKEGLTLQVLSTFGIGGLLLFWLRDRDRRAGRIEIPEIKPGTPYRTSAAKLGEPLLQTCSAIEYHLQRTALEEEWSIEWTRYNQSAADAHASHSKGEFSAALRDYAAAIHTLMAGIQMQRRQKDLAERWGIRGTQQSSTKGNGGTPLPPTKYTTGPGAVVPEAGTRPTPPPTPRTD